MKNISITVCLILTQGLLSIGFSQIIGGRTNSEQTPKVSEATKLTGGGFTGDVNHMTGEYQGSIPLGTVSTPSGLNFSLSLNYSSSFSFSTNQPMTAGIPYGEGWSPNIPTISIETDVFHRYKKSRECDEEQVGNSYDNVASMNAPASENLSPSASPFPADDEGDLYWFSPMVNIPGVGSGRAVFKYIDVLDDKCAVFVLNKFETPVEIRFYGDSWTVKIADGTVYQLGTHLANYYAPSNKRMEYYNHMIDVGVDNSEAKSTILNGDYSNPTKIKNSVEPKISYSVWHCDLIYNENYPLQGIRFDYEKFGKFNYFQEFQQTRYGLVSPNVYDATTLNYSGDYSAYTDVYLKRLTSYVMESYVDILELDYKTLDAAIDNGLILDPNHSNNTRIDDLYTAHVEKEFNSGTGFEDWKRYKHQASINNFNFEDGNPYVSSNTYNREQVQNDVNYPNTAPFNHGFLESEEMSSSDFYPGDLYELRTKITRESGSDLTNGNGTVDVALVGGAEGASPGNAPIPVIETTGQIGKSDYELTRGLDIFSTFNMALKWQMGYGQSVLQTSNFFVMPNIPSTFEDLRIQIGPGNSDIDFSYQGIYQGTELNYSYEFGSTVSNHISRNCYPQMHGLRDIKSGATIPSNFGTGHPWGMMVPIYNQMALMGSSLIGSPANAEQLYHGWWGNTSVDGIASVPTKFGEGVVLREVELVRYSKNALMLQGVRQYRINGEYSFDVPVSVIPPNGKILVSQKKLNYDVHDELTVLNYDYQNGQPVKVDQFKERRVILLSSVSEIPVNGNLYAPNYGLISTDEVLTSTLKYSKVISADLNDVFTFDDTKPYKGLNQYVLTEYIDHLGGITKLEYYPLGSEQSRILSNYNYNSTCNAMIERRPFGTGKSYTAHLAVKYLMKNDEDDPLNPLAFQSNNTVPIPHQMKRWEYVYDVNSIIRNPKEIVLRPADANGTAHFRSNFHMDVESAFSKIRVYEPGLYDAANDVYLRNYTDYEYYGGQADIYSYPAVFPSLDDYLYYGKLKSSKTYDHYGVLHEEKFINYDSTLAFQNGYERPNPWREQMGYYDDLLTRSYEYEDIYKDEVLAIEMPNGSGTTTLIGPAAYSTLDIPSFNGKAGGIMESPKFLEFYFFEMLQANNPSYMFDSYFVKKASEIVRTYENGLIKQPHAVVPDIPLSASKGDNPFGTGIENPIGNDPVRDLPIKTAIHDQKNAYIPQLITQSPLSDSVLYELISEPGIASEKKADVLALQNGMSNEVWKRLIDKMKEFPPLSMEKVISTQPYFSDDLLFHLIDHSDQKTNERVYQKALLKNPHLSDTVVKRMTGAQQIPGESFGEVISKQTQFTESMLSKIIYSANLRDAQLVNILKNQLMTDALYLQVLNDNRFKEPSVVRLMEQTIAYPSDAILLAVLNKTPLYKSESIRRILAAADREIGSNVLALVDQKYPAKEAIRIKPPLFNGNSLNKYCQNNVLTSRTYIENKTEYEYYEADYRGFVVGKPYELLQGHISSIDQPSAFPKTVDFSSTESRTIGALRLKHEPSWQVFSIKKSSPHLPGANERQEFFYWYDLQNRYDRYWFNFDEEIIGTGLGVHSYSPELTDTLVANVNWHLEFQNSGGVPILPQIDGMERSRTYGNRVIAFQKSIFTKNTRDVKPLMQSEYYDYDRRWKFNDLPEIAETQYYSGQACTNPPPPTGCQTLYECTDCYYFKYTTQEAMEALVPLNHCAWLIPGVGRVICPIGQSPLDYYPNSIEEYCNIGVTDNPTEENKAQQASSVLSRALLLRSVVIQLDTIKNTQDNDFYIKRLDAKNKYVVDFYMGGSDEEDANGFSNPVKMLMPFDNLNVRTILERNRYLQPELEKNQVDLKTRYYYNRSDNNWYVNSNCPTEGSYSTTVNTNIGLPIRITVGWDRIEGDSLVTQYEYNEIGLISKVIEPSGKYTEYSFDDFWRLTEVKENGNRLLLNNEYHTWDKNNSLSFNAKTNQNYVLNRIYNGADLTNDANIEFRKGFVDPLGREHSTIRAYKSGDDFYQIHSGTLIRDNWSRTFVAHKNHVETITALSGQTPLQMLDNTVLEYSGVIYENNPKSRAMRSSNYGVDVNDIHVVRSNYAIANYIFTSCELGLNLTELQLIMGPGSTSAYRFYRTETLDQDNKKTIAYTNAMGQQVATLSYSEANVKIVTLFAYDSYGNLTRVINPEKQQSQYKYNMLGQLVKEKTVDAGTKAYMYNKQGMISVMQDEVANNNTEEVAINTAVEIVSKPFFRVFKYDDFGRLVASGRTDQFESSNTYPVYNSNYHPLLYETTFVGDGPDQPTNIGGEDFYFDYVFTNISTQDWLANYDGMDIIGMAGGSPQLGVTTLSGFGQQFTDINSILWEKRTYYGSNALLSNIGKIIETNSFNNDGEMIQRINYTYDVNDNLAQQTIQFHPEDDLLSNPANVLTSVISYPSYNYRNAVLQQKADVDNDGIIDIHYFNEYDALNRLKAVYAASAEVSDMSAATKLVSYQYVDTNGLIDYKVQHVEGGDVATIDYTYDKRERLTKILATNMGNEIMKYRLFYDNATPHYMDGTTMETVNHHQNWNGNINGTLMGYDFSTAINPVSNFNDSTLYGFKYDGINRLIDADATVGDFLLSSNNSDPSYQIGDESMTYDKIGNIKTLLRVLKNEQNVPTDPYIKMDHFNYNYQAGNNRLIGVTGLSGSQNRTYEYDENGNLLKDSYKDITKTTVGRASYTYELIKGNEKITYLYSSADQRTYKKVELHNSDDTYTTITEEYYLMDGTGKTIAIKNLLNGTWEYFLSAGEREARLKPMDAIAKFGPKEVQFYAYDHLGNTRVTYTPEIITTAPQTNTLWDDHFVSSTDGWIGYNTATLSVNAGLLTVENTQSGFGCLKSFNATAGNTYTIQINGFLSQNSGPNQVINSTTGTLIGLLSQPTNSFTFTATSTGLQNIVLLAANAGSFQMKEIILIENIPASTQLAYQVEQVVDYYPYGKVLREFRSGGDEERYLTTQHERDQETGLDYRGARYYDSDVARFLSVDPLSMKYPGISTYVFCVDNPIIYIDPDGRDIILAGTYEEKKASFAQLQKLTNDELTYNLTTGVVTINKAGAANTSESLTSGTALINELVNHKNDVVIENVLIGSSEKSANEANAINGVGTDARVNFDMTQKGEVWTKDPVTGIVSKQETAKEIILGHELVHAYRAMEGIAVDYYKEYECYTYEKTPGVKTDKYEKTEELQTVGITNEGKYSENKLRKEQGYSERIAY